MTIAININDEQQTIEGIGCGVDYLETLTDELADFLFTTDGIGLSFGSAAIMPEGTLDIQTTAEPNVYITEELYTLPGKGAINIPKLASRGVRLFYKNLWLPHEFVEYDEGDYIVTLKADYYDDWANRIAAFLDYMTGLGITVESLSPLNEPDMYTAYNWYGIYTPAADYYNFIHNYLKPAIVASSQPNCKIVGPSCAGAAATAEYLAPFAANGHLSDIWRVITHYYPLPADYTPPYEYNFDVDFTDSHGLPIWHGEGGIYIGQTPFDPSIEDACRHAIFLHHLFADRNVSVFTEMTAWQMGWLSGAYPNLGILGAYNGGNPAIPKRAYSIGQFSKFVRPGFVRVGCSGAPVGTHVSAYKDGSNNIVSVAINETGSPQILQFVGQTTNYVDVWITDETHNLEGLYSIEVDGTNFGYIIPGTSVVSFVGVSAPTFELIASPNLSTIKNIYGADGGEIKLMNGSVGGVIKYYSSGSWQ